MNEATATVRWAACDPLLLVLLAAACGGSDGGDGTAPSTGNVDDERIMHAAEAEPGSWLTYGQTYREQRFSTLDQVTRDNVQDLGLAWTKAIGGPRECWRRSESEPISDLKVSHFGRVSSVRESALLGLLQ